jgi:hypothetical protein
MRNAQLTLSEKYTKINKILEVFMLWPGIKKLGKELQLKRTNSEVVGIIKNCFIKMYDGNGMKVLELFAPEMDNMDKEKIVNTLKQNKIKKYDWLINGIRIIFPEIIRSYSIDKIKNILDEFVEYFKLKYPVGIPQCHKCGIHKKADTYYIDNTSLYICEDCLKEYEDNINNKYQDYQQLPTNYFNGFIGALVFSVPGIFLTILFFIFFNKLAAVSTLLYIFLGIKGYKIFKGKISPFGAFLIIMVGIIMTGLGILAAYSVYIMKEIKTIDINKLISIFKIPEIQKEFKMNLIMSYIVSGLYLVFQLFQMIREWKFSIKIEKARDM